MANDKIPLHERDFFVVKSVECVEHHLPRFMRGKRFNRIASNGHDKKGNPKIALFWNYNGERRSERVGLIICYGQELHAAALNQIESLNKF